MLIIANPAIQGQPMQTLQQLGLECHAVCDPYSAMTELLAAKANFRGVVVSLQSLYREEIAMVRTLKRRLPHLEVWLAHTDNRQAALAEAMRFGADGLLGDEGLHRIAAPTMVESETPVPFAGAPIQLPQPAPESEAASHEELQSDDPSVGEPVLTADELRALLQEQPSMPPSSGSEN
jgi:hypothetical protein